MSKIKYEVPFTTNYSDAPLIKMRQGDLEFYAIVDTGSESTLVDNNFRGTFVFNSIFNDSAGNEDITFVGFNGTSDPISTLCMTSIHCSVVGETDEFPITINATMTDLSPIQNYFDKWTGGEIQVPMLIGSDTFIKTNSTIDFENNRFSFYNNSENDED